MKVTYFYKPMFNLMTNQWYIVAIKNKQGACCFKTKAEAEKYIKYAEKHPC